MARAQSERTLRGRVAVVGIGETEYYRHGASPDPEFKLALKAILAACNDAGVDPREIDGFSSYSDDRSEASRLAAALAGEAEAVVPRWPTRPPRSWRALRTALLC